MNNKIIKYVVDIIIIVTCAEYLFRVGYSIYPFIIIILTVILMVINFINHKKLIRRNVK
jgi:uncharacterized membrane protein YkvI